MFLLLPFYFEGLGVAYRVLERKKLEEKFEVGPDVGW